MNGVLARKQSDTPGWFSTKEGKLSLLGDYRKALASGEFINRSYQAIREAREYVFTATGSVEHARSINTVDPTGARENHGDRVIADALVLARHERISYSHHGRAGNPAALSVRTQDVCG